MTGVADPVILSANVPSCTTILFISIVNISLAHVFDSFTVEEHRRRLDLPNLAKKYVKVKSKANYTMSSMLPHTAYPSGMGSRAEKTFEHCSSFSERCFGHRRLCPKSTHGSIVPILQKESKSFFKCTMQFMGNFFLKSLFLGETSE